MACGGPLFCAVTQLRGALPGVMAFDLAAACESCQPAWILMDPIVSNGNFVLDSCSEFSCYRKGVFILLFSESHRLLCNKNWINTTISWGQYFSPLIMDESWCHWYQNDPGQARILKI